MFIKYLIPALLFAGPIVANANQSLQNIPADIDMRSAEVSRGYLDAQLGATFMRELLEGDESRFRHYAYTDTGISWHNIRYLSLPEQFRVQEYYRPHEAMRPDPFLDDYRHEPNALEVQLQTYARTDFRGYQRPSHEQVSYSGFFIRKPDPLRFDNDDLQSMQKKSSDESGMNVVGMLINIQYGPADFPRPIQTMNELKYMNANMLFASWAFNNKELLPD